jgi:hypothetical protein
VAWDVGGSGEGYATKDVVSKLLGESCAVNRAPADPNAPIRLACVSWLSRLPTIGESFPLKFTRQNPVHFAEKNGGLALIVGAIRVDSVYNTLRLPDRARAGKVATEYLIPTLRRVPSELYNGRVSYIGVYAVYGKRDFSDEASSPKGEFLAVVAPVSAIKQLSASEITNEDFVSRSDVYLGDSNDFSKITMKLE